MNIAIISTPVFPIAENGLAGYGGLEQIAWERAKWMAQLGHKVTLFAPEGSQCPGVEVFHFGPVRCEEFQAYHSYKKELNKFDVIIDDSWQKWSYYHKMRKGLATPVLGVMHAPVETMYRTLPAIDKPCFVCISKDQATAFTEMYRGQANAEVAYNGVNTEMYNITGQPRTKRFLFVARFSVIKGADIAIQACLEVDVELDLIGDTSITNEPDYYKHCTSLASKGKPNQIRIIGSQSRNQCVWWMNQAHAFLHPNPRFREPFGLAPVEAQLCGLPVITFNNGAMRETCDEVNVCDDYAEFLETVRIIKNCQIDNRYEIRNKAKYFSVQNMASRYVELCEKALKEPW